MKSLVSFFFIPFILPVSSCFIKPDLKLEEAQQIAKEAYIFRYPMVMGYKAMNAHVLDEIYPEYKGHFNYLACDARFLTPADKAIVIPNTDTPYCMVWGDFRNEPLVNSTLYPIKWIMDESAYEESKLNLFKSI